MKNQILDLHGEKWVTIKGFKGKYQVSNSGKIKSFKRDKNGIILKNKRNGSGYDQISLSHMGINIQFTVHRLVGAAFIPNPLNLPELNHLDRDKRNNHVSNLEWISRKDNMKHAADTGYFKKPIHEHKSTKSVINVKTGEIFGSLSNAANSINISNSLLSRYLSGKLKNYSDFKLYTQLDPPPQQLQMLHSFNLAKKLAG